MLKLLEPFSQDAEAKSVGGITKSKLYSLGLSGRDDSAARREKLLKALELPHTMSPNAMLSALNILYTAEEIEEKVKQLFD